MTFLWFRRRAQYIPKLIVTKRIDPFTEPRFISYKSEDGQVHINGCVHPTGRKRPMDGAFLIVKEGQIIHGLFDGVSLNRGDEAVKAAMDFLVPRLLDISWRLTTMEVIRILRECSREMYSSLYKASVDTRDLYSLLYKANAEYALTTLTLAIFNQNGRNWNGHMFVMGDSPAYVFKRKKDGRYENSVLVGTNGAIFESLHGYLQDRSCVSDPLGVEHLRLVHRKVSLTPWSTFMTVTDGISANLEIVLLERSGQSLNWAQVVDGNGFCEMARLVLREGLSNEAILRLVLERMDSPDHTYYMWDPATDGKPPGKLERIRKTLHAKLDDSVSLFRIEIG